MKNKITLYTILFLLLISITSVTYSQEPDKDYSSMTKEEIMDMSYEELLELPFEDLIKLANTVGVSAEELLQMVLNKEVSTASKKAESVYESPLSTSVITEEEIMNSGVNSIPELFRSVPGMIVREKSNGNYDVHIRGNDNVPPGNFTHFSENTLTLVMIDNRIVYNYINGGTFWETLPVSMNDIKRIDIVRGPSSALYGPNAVSGVINIITKNPQTKKFKVDLDQRYGNYNTKLTNFYSSFGISDELRFKVTGNYEYRDRFMSKYYSFKEGEYLSADSLKSIFGYDYTGGERNTLPTPDMSRDRWGATFSAFYDPAEDVNFRFASGMQTSEVQTIFFENLATPFANRYSKTKFLDFSADVKGVSLQASYMGGEQDLSVGLLKPVIHYDMNYLNLNLEYNWQVNDDLSIRPGVNFQQASYDDSPYVEEAQKNDPNREGILNGKQKLKNYGASMRFDYQLIDNLRLIAALRADQYDKPKDTYFSYQFGGSYNLSEKHLFRAVYSQANRGAFIGNVYSDFKNPLGSQPGGTTTIEYPPGSGNPMEVPVIIDNYYQYYLGNENIDLLTMNMIEFGHRWKIQNNLQTDIEVFYTKTKDFDAFQQVGVGQEFNNLDASDPANPVVHVDYHDSLRYENLDITAIQTGASFSLNYKPTNDLLLKVFGTYQNTQLKDYMPNDATPDSLVDIDHEWTPTFYGGLTVNYTPMSKINIYSNVYYFTEQTYNRYESPFAGQPESVGGNPNEIGTDKISSKYIVNLRIAYNFREKSSVYFNARNILDNQSREFGFADDIKGLYMVGARFHF